METKNKPLYFAIILVLTLIVIRMITYYIFDPNIIIKGFELHHLYYGIALLIIGIIYLLFNKKTNLLNLAFFAIGIGLIIDEVEYVLRGFGGTEQYASTLPSAIILTLIVILITIFIKYKSKK